MLAHLVLIQPEQHVDAGRLDVGVYDADTLARQGDLRGQVGSGVRFSRPAPERMDGYDLLFAIVPPIILRPGMPSVERAVFSPALSGWNRSQC